MTVMLLVCNTNIQDGKHGIIQPYVIAYVTVSVNMPQMAVKCKTIEIQTWKKHLFLDGCQLYS
jgi:hypothetical protein